jgi:predicted ArsR family transcriptional regulator
MVATALGLHANTTRFHLDALAAQGLVLRETEQRTAPGRPRVLYRARDGHRPDRYQDLAAAMVRHFAGPMDGRSALARQAGAAWGEELRGEFVRADPAQPALQRVLACMAGLGYAPELEGDDLVVLRPCPFAEVAGEDPDVVCQLHLGLIRGLLGTDQPLRVREIRPWVTEDRCEVDLYVDGTVPGDAVIGGDGSDA